jgi:hypothetical protein
LLSAGQDWGTLNSGEGNLFYFLFFAKIDLGSFPRDHTIGKVLLLAALVWQNTVLFKLLSFFKWPCDSVLSAFLRTVFC